MKRSLSRKAQPARWSSSEMHGKQRPGPNGRSPLLAGSILPFRRRALESLQSRKCRGIEFAAEISLQGVDKNLSICRGIGEQCHRRSELQIIGIAEDLFDRAPLDEIYQPRAFGEPRAKDRMLQIRGGFGERRNGEPAGQLT